MGVRRGKKGTFPPANRGLEPNIYRKIKVTNLTQIDWLIYLQWQFAGMTLRLHKC